MGASPGTSGTSGLDRLGSALATAWEAARPHRRLMIIVPAVAAVLSIVAVLIVTPRYKADFAFVAEAPSLTDLPSAVLGIAGELGLNGSSSTSPQFYADLLSTRPILDSLLTTKPTSECKALGAPNLLGALGSSGKSRDDSLFLARKKLGDLIDSDVNIRTGVVSVSIQAPCAGLAVELADTLFSELNAFNVRKRQTSARARREYASARVREADSALTAAEDALEAFNVRNRSFDVSPQLRLESDRLTRQVNMQQDLAMTLHREYESARLDEVNSTPALTRLQLAALPIKPTWPKRRLTVILVTAFAMMVGVGLAILRTLVGPLPDGCSERLRSWHEWLDARRGAWSLRKRSASSV